MPSAKRIAERHILTEAVPLLEAAGYTRIDNVDTKFTQDKWLWLKADAGGVDRLFHVKFQDSKKVPKGESAFTFVLDLVTAEGQATKGHPARPQRMSGQGVPTVNVATVIPEASPHWWNVSSLGLSDEGTDIPSATSAAIEWLDQFSTVDDVYEWLADSGDVYSAVTLGLELGRPEAENLLRQRLTDSTSKDPQDTRSFRTCAARYGVDISDIRIDGYVLRAFTSSTRDAFGDGFDFDQTSEKPIPTEVRADFVERLANYRMPHNNKRFRRTPEEEVTRFRISGDGSEILVEEGEITFASSVRSGMVFDLLVTAWDLARTESLTFFDPQKGKWEDFSLSASEVEGYKLVLLADQTAPLCGQDLQQVGREEITEAQREQIVEHLIADGYKHLSELGHHGWFWRPGVSVEVAQHQVTCMSHPKKYPYQRTYESGLLQAASELAVSGKLALFDPQTSEGFDSTTLKAILSELPNSQYPEAIRRMRLAELSGFDVLASDTRHWYDVVLVAPSSRDAFRSGVPFAEIEHEVVDESTRTKVIEFLERRNYRRIEGEGPLGRFEHDPGVAVTVSEDRIWFVASNDPALAGDDGPVFEVLQTASEITSVVDLAKFDPQPPGVWDDGVLPES